MDQVKGMRKDVKSTQEEKTMEDPRTREVLPKLKGMITHQHIQQGSHIHLKNHKAS